MLCGDHTETANHLLFQCRIAREAKIAWILYGTGGKPILKRVSFCRTNDLCIQTKKKEWLSQRRAFDTTRLGYKGITFHPYLVLKYPNMLTMELTKNLINQKSKRRVHTSLQEFCMYFITLPKARYDSHRPTNDYNNRT